MILRNVQAAAAAAAALLLAAGSFPAAAGERPALRRVQVQAAGPGTWLVSAGAGLFADHRPGDVAMYRAAELAEAGGFAFFQVLRTSAEGGGEHDLFGRLADLGGERVELKIRGVQDRAAPLACEMPQGAGCSVHPVAETLRAMGFRLGLRPAAAAPARP